MQVLSKYKKNGMHVKHGVIVMDEEVFRDMTEFDEGLRPFLLPRFRPMLVEPNDWTAFNEVRLT